MDFTRDGVRISCMTRNMRFGIIGGTDDHADGDEPFGFLRGFAQAQKCQFLP